MEMGIGEIIALVGVCIIAIGLVATWRKNGDAQAARDIAQAEKDATFQQGIKSDIEHIEEELKSDDHGLVALAKGMGDFKTHCAKVSTGLAGKVESNTTGIKELKEKVGRRRS